jgi:DNA polymerase III epsilon subunit family exonuclease
VIAAIIDTETTGLTLPSAADIAKQPRIIELAVARVDADTHKVVSTHEWLIWPEQDVSAEITKITGITNDMLKGKPQFRQVLGEIEEAFGGADLLIAHNAPFDVSCLQYELDRCARTCFPWPKETICTVQEYYHIEGRRLKLTELYLKKVGRELHQSHRALDDVLALVEILIADGVL